MAEPTIIVSDVSKTFKLPHEKQASIKSMFVNLFRGHRTFERQKVLNKVSLEIQQGEFFGIVGRNGSGKSTLLKLLAGIYSPDEGHIQLNGKLTPFIELGVGFNPELTGRENVFLNGALLGFSQKEMGGIYDDIVEFAELEKFMDQKLKNYSSGMQVRLAFSIAIRVKSDILLIDEVLAVGDEAFQRKCVDVFESYKAQKQTVVLVTHDMEAVKRFCSRAMLINEGEIIAIGNPRDVAERYSQLNQEATDNDVARDNIRRAQEHLLKARVLNSDLRPKNGFKFGESMVVEIDWSAIEPKSIESVGVHLFKLSGEHLTGINSRTGKLREDWKQAGRLGIEFKLDVLPGKYNVLVEVFEVAGKPIDSIRDELQFTVAKHEMEWSGLIELPHTWREDVKGKGA